MDPRTLGLSAVMLALLAPPAVADDAPPPAGIRLRGLGFLRLAGALMQDDPNVPFVGRADGFELQYARAGVDADLGPRVSARLSIDGALDERERINEPNGKLQVGLRDAYADVHLGGQDLRAGHFEPVFDGEQFLSPTERPFVERALYSRGVRATAGFETPGLSPGRSLGVAFRREPARSPTSGLGAGFEIAVQNGAAELSSNNDNDWVAISVAGILRLPRGGWAIAAGRWNARSEGDLPARQDETDLQGSAAGMIALGPVWIGGGGVVQRTTFATTGGAVQNAWGAHAQLLGGLLQREGLTVSAGYRFAIFDPSTLVLTDRMMEHTIGAIASWPDYHLRLLGGVTHATEQAVRKLANSRVEAVVEVAW